MSDFGAVIPAAGSGSRMHSDTKKQFMLLAGKPLIYYSLKAFKDVGIKEIILICDKEDTDRCQRILKESGLDGIKIIEGGSCRGISVYNGLLAMESEYVLIHDGARPLVDTGIITRCMDGARKYNAAIASVPVKDTIKEADKDGLISTTPDRSRMHAAQTPQTFRTELIKDGYKKAIEEGWIDTITDDGSVLERLGYRVMLVEGSDTNIKVTTQTDLLVAEGFLKSAGKAYM